MALQFEKLIEQSQVNAKLKSANLGSARLIDTSAKMDQLLAFASPIYENKIFKYVGEPTDAYKPGSLYTLINSNSTWCYKELLTPEGLPLTALNVTENGTYLPEPVNLNMRPKPGDIVTFKSDLSYLDLEQFRTFPQVRDNGPCDGHDLISDNNHLIRVIYKDEGAPVTGLVICGSRSQPGWIVYLCGDDAWDGPGWYMFTWDILNSSPYKIDVDPAFDLPTADSSYYAAFEVIADLFASDPILPKGVELKFKDVLDSDLLDSLGNTDLGNFEIYYTLLNQPSDIGIRARYTSVGLSGLELCGWDYTVDRPSIVYGHYFMDPTGYLDSYESITYEGIGWYCGEIIDHGSDGYSIEYHKVSNIPVTFTLPTNSEINCSGTASQQTLARFCEPAISNPIGFRAVNVDVRPKTKALNITENGVYGIKSDTSITQKSAVNLKSTLTQLDFTSFSSCPMDTEFIGGYKLIYDPNMWILLIARPADNMLPFDTLIAATDNVMALYVFEDNNAGLAPGWYDASNGPDSMYKPCENWSPVFLLPDYDEAYNVDFDFIVSSFISETEYIPLYADEILVTPKAEIDIQAISAMLGNWNTFNYWTNSTGDGIIWDEFGTWNSSAGIIGIGFGRVDDNTGNSLYSYAYFTSDPSPYVDSIDYQGPGWYEDIDGIFIACSKPVIAMTIGGSDTEKWGFDGNLSGHILGVIFDAVGKEEGIDSFSSVIVNVSMPDSMLDPIDTRIITKNGTYGLYPAVGEELHFAKEVTIDPTEFSGGSCVSCSYVHEVVDGDVTRFHQIVTDQDIHMSFEQGFIRFIKGTYTGTGTNKQYTYEYDYKWSFADNAWAVTAGSLDAEGCPVGTFMFDESGVYTGTYTITVNFDSFAGAFIGSHPMGTVTVDVTAMRDLVSNQLYEITAEDLKGITYIRPYAFACTPCDFIEIPTTVTAIADTAFYFSSVSEIRYDGTLAELKALFESGELPLDTFVSFGQYVCSDGTQSWTGRE